MRTTQLGWVALLVVACAEAAGEGGGAGQGGADGGGGEGTIIAVPCSVADPCEPGTACVNGVCALGCNTDTDCEASDYCALELGQVCQPRTLPTCPETTCVTSQACVEGLCATQTSTPCAESPFNPGDDGCPADELCLGAMLVNDVMVEPSLCYALPACGPDYNCPVGASGSVCSFGLLGDKAPFCIPSGCVGPENCPTGAACVRLGVADLLGACSTGEPGSRCTTGAECATAQCVIEAAGQFGRCQ